jgi:PAS domain-containing protein
LTAVQAPTRQLPARRLEEISIWNSGSLWLLYDFYRWLNMTLSEHVPERKRAEEALRDAEELLRRLIACSQDCVKMLDLNGSLLWMRRRHAGARDLRLGPFRK